MAPRKDGLPSKPKKSINTLEKILALGIVQDMGYETPCLLWPRTKDKKGYGKVKWRGKLTSVHRVIMDPENECPWLPCKKFMIDHKCGIRHCYRKDHLRWVTNQENILAGVPYREPTPGSPTFNATKTHCDHGHEFSTQNTKWRTMRNSPRTRICRRCYNDYHNDLERRQRQGEVMPRTRVLSPRT